jgi:hypothetical protein
MNHVKADDNTRPLQALTLFRGIYKRIADKLDVDPSYVSRVARGERKSEVIEAALRKEMQKILGDGYPFNGDGAKFHRELKAATTTVRSAPASANGHGRDGKQSSRK